MADAPVIAVRGVHKTFKKKPAVMDCTFTVERLSCFGLLGPNGAGKTTMMKMIYGMCRRDARPRGEISVFGHDPDTDELAIKYLSGVVPQENNLDEELNVRLNLTVFSKFYCMPRRRARARIEELLDFLELGEKANAKIKELSGGMKRRLVIARALLNSPRLLILDEPTTGLDPQVRHVIWEKLRSLQKNGLTILLTTHYMEEAARLCDRIIIMDRGRNIIEGNPRELVEQEMERYVLEVSDTASIPRIRHSPQAGRIRLDESGDAARVYGSDPGLLRELGAAAPPGRWLLRETNLEDLFLKSTGNRLNEQQ